MARLTPLWMGTLLAAGVALGSCCRTDVLDFIDDPYAVPVDAGPEPVKPVGCVTGKISLTQATPAVMFVLDRSGSMNSRIGSGQQSRWEALTSALSSALPAVDETMEIGALIFPTGSQQSNCTVPGQANLSTATGHVNSLLNLLTSTRPGGATPTADALQSAAGQLSGVRAATAARALVLATDGAPNCNASLDASTCTCASGTRNCARSAIMCLDDDRTVSEIAGFHAQGLPTYVIGIQDPFNTESVDVLNAMAVAGGRPHVGGAQSYYAATSEAELTAALVAIRDQVGACEYLTTSVPDAQGSIAVTLDGEVIPYDPSGASGWSWANRANGEILILGSVCQALAAATHPLVEAEVVCDPDAGL